MTRVTAYAFSLEALKDGDTSRTNMRCAAAERRLDTPRWNFHKYLVGGDGHIAAVFASTVEAPDPRVIAIERELSEA